MFDLNNCNSKLEAFKHIKIANGPTNNIEIQHIMEEEDFIFYNDN